MKYVLEQNKILSYSGSNDKVHYGSKEKLVFKSLVVFFLAIFLCFMWSHRRRNCSCVLLQTFFLLHFKTVVLIVFPLLVRDGRVQGILEVSRSFGDGRFKHCGVISTPDIKRCTLTDNDR